ncbi:hypothetical protein [Chondromyces apiculatus]|nr:hypothetical protein [Chondromyces apiculatus]
MASDTQCVLKPPKMISSGEPASFLRQEEDGVVMMEYPLSGGGIATDTLRLTPLGERYPGDEVLIPTGEVDTQGRATWELFEVGFLHQELRQAS